MSFYNMLFGVNHLAPLALAVAGLDSSNDVPRFRDAFFAKDDSGKTIVAIYTRTGGGNRDFYESEAHCRANYPEYFKGEDSPSGPWNDDLAKLPGYLTDEDDDFDSTYATFYYKVEESFRPIIDMLDSLGALDSESPTEKFAKMLEQLRNVETTAATERVVRVGKAILKKILEDPKDENASD